ncbi:maleylpyruvate isomerase family mycothiol-dependent enzyme [Rugosimonospora acidiphila]|uniref:maleylpyruvate isomerase family mycothiol-dependent enzyme n=1 Tax=Rugosimonospora acidiphila TaxID=556531 RepID=UPI0031E88ED5
MTADPLALIPDLDRATQRVIATADALKDPAAPSLLPGWSQGHVLTHLARNADSMVNLLTWARTGVVTPQYPSWEVRESDIEAGAGRPLADQIADLRDSSARFAEAASALPAEAWSAELSVRTGPIPAALVPWRRLREVEIHHADLGADYAPRDWPEAFAHRLLHEVATGREGISCTLRAASLGHPVVVGTGGPPTINGPAYALAAWLTGRSTGDGLVVEPIGPLPALPDWI